MTWFYLASSVIVIVRVLLGSIVRSSFLSNKRGVSYVIFVNIVLRYETNPNQFLDRQFSFVPFLIGLHFHSDVRMPFFAPYMYDHCLWKYDMHLLLIYSVLLLHALVQNQITSRIKFLRKGRPVRRYGKSQGK